MLKKLPASREAEIRWQGEVVATVRHLAPADVAAILVTVGEDIAGLLGIAENIDAIKQNTTSQDALADQLLAQWPKVLNAVLEHMPNLMAQIIARAAGEPDSCEMVRDDYPITIQVQALTEIASLTFDGPEGFKLFVGNVLLLLDLGGKLSSSGKKRNSRRTARPSLAGGSTT